jgi:alpha-beta hydrolase superfamily lysophospholipase
VKILYLHGWNSLVGGVKPTHLRSRGHEVIEPALDHDDFERALATAQAAFDEHRPNVVVGSSRGGAVAMNLRNDSAWLVLLCPAWRKWGSARTVNPGTIILHSRGDDVIPFEESLELVRASGLPDGSLVEVGSDHRLADPEPLAALAGAVEVR